MENNSRFLQHLAPSEIPNKAHNYMLSTYSIILEAWRRGLEISIRIVLEKSGNIEPYFSISDGKKIHRFSVTRGDLVSNEAKLLTKNKQEAKEMLVKNNVPTPEGTLFSKEANDEEIIQYAEKLHYPVVIKPLQGTGGRGVIGNIQNKEELSNALQYVRRDLKSPEIIVEKYFIGDDYRLYVLDGKVIGALKRLRAYVIGNGKDTIEQLIHNKNKERMKLPALSNRPIKIDKETETLLKRKNYDLKTTILPEGEILYLKTKNNVSAGGESIDVTDEISENIKSIAVKAAESFPSLPHCGLDMIVDEEKDIGVIIELNSRAHITQHLFPMKGKARDIPSHIIDYYFPETKNYNREEASKLYLDYDFIFDASLSRNASEIKIPRIPSSPIILKRYIISGITYTDKIALRIRRIAFNNRVNGYIKHLDNGNISIILGGNQKQVDTFEEKVSRYLEKLSKNIKITPKTRKTPIKHGFHIELEPIKQDRSNNTDSIDTMDYMKKYSTLKMDYQRALERLVEYEQKEKEMELTKKQNKQLKKQLKKMESSTSWKLTKPIRAIGNIKK